MSDKTFPIINIDVRDASKLSDIIRSHAEGLQELIGQNPDGELEIWRVVGDTTVIVTKQKDGRLRVSKWYPDEKVEETIYG